MFEIGWSEIMVIAVVAIVVVGPKELPGMLRTLGKSLGQVRRMSNDFKRQFDEALREAERSAGLEDTKKQLQSVSNPLAGMRKEIEGAMRSGDAPKPSTAPQAAATASVAVPAEPLKTGTAGGTEGSGAA